MTDSKFFVGLGCRFHGRGQWECVIAKLVRGQIISWAHMYSENYKRKWKTCDDSAYLTLPAKTFPSI